MDALNVLRLVQAEYTIDSKHIFLMGHSMGGNGTWALAAKHPHHWAAIAPISSGQATPAGFGAGSVQPIGDLKHVAGKLSPYPFERIAHLPVIVCHGARDPRADVKNARATVAAMKQRGMNYQYFEHPTAMHAMLQNSLKPIFKFFDHVARSR